MSKTMFITELWLENHDKELLQNFAHDLKENFNAEFPLNHPSTKPFFTLDNVRMIVEEQLKEQK